ncbi:hypothetical protein B9Z55_006520 [Caenorhabditis nigoni]|uniref:Uncharacterized protein n=1 Tax=Caenorhabditis nigoni TaxID=1611254 RepID=A0A2G5V5K6_9PELO|nr:hypothetical protein B9Z55_010006 [Caenorhabditis nigoni]PIC47037.1 hypothetical protein B9Z55_006520 [Caenorhabditis nigoni]
MPSSIFWRMIQAQRQAHEFRKMLEASPHCSARRSLLTKMDGHRCNEWPKHNNQGHNNTVDSPTKSLTESGLPTTSGRREHHQQSESQHQLDEDKKKKMKAHQLGRSSKEVERPKTKVMMTQHAPETQKTCLASKKDGWTTQSPQRIGNRNFSQGWNSKVNNIRSVCSHQEEEIKSTARTIQSRSLPSRSSTRGVKTTQVKQTVTMRQSTRPERSVKRVWFSKLLMTVVVIRMNSCKRILSNGYNSCVSRTPEVVLTSLNFTQRTDDGGTRWRMYKTNSRQRKVDRLQLQLNEQTRHQTLQEC